MRNVIVLVTTEDGELLDRKTIEVPDGHRFVAVKPVNYSIGHNQCEEVLDIGERNP
jgi:hypothetical protein